MKISRALLIAPPFFLLVACGGGGGGSAAVAPAPTAAVQPTITTLTGSGGNMSKYIGTWKSDCGYNIIGTNMGKSQTNTFTFTSANGNTLNGTLLVQLYSDIQCTSYVVGQSDFPIGIVITYEGNIAVTSGTPPDMNGFVDQLTVKQIGFTSSQPMTVGFNASFSKFRQETGSYFSNTSLSYSKQ
jgi:hypothetical protein